MAILSVFLPLLVFSLLKLLSLFSKPLGRGLYVAVLTALFTLLFLLIFGTLNIGFEGLKLAIPIALGFCATFAAGQSVVQPGEYCSAYAAVDQCPGKADETAGRADRIATVEATQPSNLAGGSFKSDYPPGKEKNAKAPDKAARQRKSFYIELHFRHPFAFN